MIGHVFNALELKEHDKPEISVSCITGCERCQQHCPHDAIDLASKTIDEKKCTHCGECIFTCPVSAIQGLGLPLRFIIDDYLFVEPSMTNEELYGWMAYKPKLKGIFCLQLTVPQCLAISLLKTFERKPLLKVKKAEIDPSKRVSLSSRERLPIKYLRPQPFYTVDVVQEKCVTCWTCSNVCPTGALSRNGSTWTIDSDLCHGCRQCESMCANNAVFVNEGRGSEPAKEIHLESCQCKQCQQAFYSISSSNDLCFICSRKPQLEMAE